MWALRPNGRAATSRTNATTHTSPTPDTPALAGWICCHSDRITNGLRETRSRCRTPSGAVSPGWGRREVVRWAAPHVTHPRRARARGRADRAGSARCR